jgi:transporter family-2 protein
VLGPRLTGAAFLALTLVGQMVAALIVDRYGAIGFAEQPVTVWRVLGVVLLVFGVLLIMRR